MEVEKFSGQISHNNQQSYIKIQTLDGKNPNEIHIALRDV
jgi:hypothetical protein